MKQLDTPSSIINRRSFLRTSALGVSVLASGIGACGGCGFRSSGNTTQGSSRAARHRLPDEPAPPEQSRITVIRNARFPTHRAALEHAISSAGGLDFIQPGATVLLKPAANSANRYPATTDPETISIVAEMVKEAGGKPWVADRTMFLRSTEEVFRKTQIYDAAEQSGIPCRSLEQDEVVSIHHPLAEHWGENRVPIYASVIEADHIINLCTPRTHGLGDFTMSMKNNVGVVNGGSRLRMHLPWGLRERLAEINLVVRPSLIVMDGREGFADGGPDSGDLVRPGFIAVGSDPVAMDAVGLACLRLQGANEDISGRSIWDLPMMKRAAEIGLGVSSSRQIHLAAIDPTLETALRAEMA